MSENEIQRVFAENFSGLDLSNSVGNIPPDKASVFHNCEVSLDGAIVRRKGTQRIFDVTGGVGTNWSTSVRTRGGSEYFVYVSSVIHVILMEDVPGIAPVLKSIVTKSGMWTQPLRSVNFVALSAPHDRLLLLTGNHPPVQLSFIERTTTFTCTAISGGFATMQATSSASDSPMWRDNTALNYIVTDANNAVVPVTSKIPGVAFTTPASSYVLNTEYTFTIRQVTWQWWAESLQWEGADFQQTVNRLNVSDADQSLAVPERIRSDLDPIYRNSQEMGINVFDRTQYGLSAYTRTPVPAANENQYAFSSGGRYGASASTTPSPVSPFFITFGARNAGGGVNPVHFLRARELRFRGGDGVALQDLVVTINDEQCAIDTTPFQAPSLLFFSGASVSYTATERVLSYRYSTNPSTICQYITFWYDYLRMPYEAIVDITSVEASNQFINGVQRVWYKGLPTTGGALDGCFVRAYGLGAFANYRTRQYPAEGAYCDSRLVLKNPPGYADELLFSGVSDTIVPGEFYSYFQITDALDGSYTDPFTVSITQSSREQITAIVPWQDSIFIFTNAQTYSLKSQGPLSGTNYETSLISSYGAYNSRCVVVSNLTVLYMNSSGVFDLLNKSNTSDYGSFQRSQPVSELFEDLAPASLDRLHWLSHNTSENVLHVGLASQTDTLTTSKLLRLDLTRGSWSTVSSAKAFNLRGAVQLFDRTCYLARIEETSTIAVLSTEMPFYLDWAYAVGIPSFPFNCRLLNEVFTSSIDKYGIVSLPHTTAPGLSPYTIPSSTVVNGNTWISASSTPQVTLRNVLLDMTDSVALLNGRLADQRNTAVVRPDQNRTLYASSVFSGSLSDPVQITGVNGTNGASLTASGLLHFVGSLYTSVYASPTINLEMLGGVSRFSRLLMQFDPSVVSKLSYPVNASARVLNAAALSYQVGAQDSFATILEDLGADEISKDTALALSPTVTRRAVEMSLPIQGRGSDFRFWVSSVGAEAFKLSSYEVTGVPQKDKKYVRR